MSEFIINNPLYVHLLWAVAVVGAVMVAAMVYRRRAMARFATANLHRVLAPQIRAGRRWTKVLLLTGALTAMTAALIDVRWGRAWREVPQRGVDVMFVLDVSHSMLAQDAAPSRLERAKQDILDIVRDMQGDRVGLVTFAGDTAQKTPLTTNYREFQLMLDEVGPHSVSRGGSDLGRALEMAARGFIDKSANHKAIVVFSDGEDQDSKPAEIAKSLSEKRGIRIFTVGLGDEHQGARIPMRANDGRRAWLQYDGQDVWTKMNGKVLEEVALAANGAYVPAGTQHVSMDQVYKQHIASIEQHQYEQARVNTYIPRYQWFVGLALLLAGAEVLLRDVKKVRMPRSLPVTVGVALLSISFLAAAPAQCFAAEYTPGASPLPASAAAGPVALAKQPAAKAAPTEASSRDASPETAQAAVPETPEAAFNRAVELYRSGKTDEAGALWSEVAQSARPELAAKSHFNLGNCSYAAATKLKDQQPEQAMHELNKAIAHYRDSLKLNRADQDARVNIELAARLRDQLRKHEEQKKQQQKQQDQQKQDQQKQDPKQDQHDQQQKQDQKQSQQDKQQSDQQQSDQQKPDQQQNRDQSSNQQQDQQQQEQEQNSQQSQQQNNAQDQQPKQDYQPSQDEKQSSQAPQNHDEKSDSKQDEKEGASSSAAEAENKEAAQQPKPQEDKQQAPKHGEKSSEPKHQPNEKQLDKPAAQDKDQPSEEQSKQGRAKQDEAKQDEGKQQDGQGNQEKQDQSSSAAPQPEKQPEQQKQQRQQDAQNQQQPEQKQPEQKQQPGEQPKPDKGHQPSQQPSQANESKMPADQQHAQQSQRDEKPMDLSGEEKKPEPQKQQPEIKPGQKLEASDNAAQPGAAEQVSDADMKDPKTMSKDEAAKMLQAIRDRDLLRRMQQLRKEQSQRRPVDKDW